MLAGFVHGVMNTDNMTISGETIDYGPCAFMEAFDPATVFSSIDSGGRYAYGNQPAIALWNLARFAEALLPLLGDTAEDAERAVALAEETLGAFGPRYEAAWSAGMRAKLGVAGAAPETVDSLVTDLLTQMQQSRVDHTSFYRRLGRGRPRGRRAGARRVHRPGRVRRVAGQVARTRTRPDSDGSRESDLRPAQPPRRGGADRRERR